MRGENLRPSAPNRANTVSVKPEVFTVCSLMASSDSLPRMPSRTYVASRIVEGNSLSGLLKNLRTLALLTFV